MLFKNIAFQLVPVLLASFCLTFTSCNKDDDDNSQPNEEELITTVKLTFTNQQTNAVSVFEGKDLDGVGGNPPQIDQITLNAQSTYTLEVEFLDESNAQNVKDITEEVAEEGGEHLICYSFTGSITQVQTTDKDGAGAPLGLTATLSTGNTGNASLGVTLKHEPNKSAASPCSTGETDVELTFGVVVQ